MTFNTNQNRTDSYQISILPETQKRLFRGVRTETANQVEKASKSSVWSVVQTPPSSGKTTAAVKLADKDDRPVTYFTVREDLYKQAESIAEKNGLDNGIIPSPYRDCPTFRGDHDDDEREWSSEMDILYHLDITAKEIHMDWDMPCEPDCPYLKKWSQFDPDDYDIIIGHYLHAYIDSVTKNRIVFFDEFDGDQFITTFINPSKHISYFLERRPNIPFDGWGDLVDNRDVRNLCRKTFEQFQKREHLNNLKAHEVLNSPSGGVHTKSGWLTLSILLMNDLGNGFETTRGFTEHPFSGEQIPLEALEDERRLLGNKTAVWNRNKNKMHLLSPPDLSNSKTVIGLDGTATINMWNTTFDGCFEKRNVVSDGDMGMYLKAVMDYHIRQNTDGVKAYYSANSVSTDKDEALFLETELREGQKPYLISTQTAIDEYEKSGAINRVADSMNYGNVESSNDIGNEKLLVVSGSCNPGDDVIKMWSAFAGETAVPNRNKETNEGFGMDLSYGSYGDDILHHFRENRIIQSMFRVGRNGQGATIVINTAATPDWLEPDEVISTELFAGNKKRQIIDALRENGPFTQSELVDEIGVNQSNVSRTLDMLTGSGYVKLAGTNDEGTLLFDLCVKE